MKSGNEGLTRYIPLLILVGLLVFFVGQVTAEDEEEDGGTIIFTQPVKAVVFEHKIHVDQGIECDSCHSDIFEMEAGNAESNDDFTMASLYDGKYCGTCHDGDMAFASNTRCTACHIGVKGYNRMTGRQESTGHEE